MLTFKIRLPDFVSTSLNIFVVVKNMYVFTACYSTVPFNLQLYQVQKKKQLNVVSRLR